MSNAESGPGAEAAEYIRSVTALLSGRDPIEVLSALPATLRATLAGVSKNYLERPEAPGKWSIVQVVEHLADTEIVYGYRLRMALTTDTPHFTDYDQERWVERFSGAPLEESMGQLEVLRAANLRVLRSLTEDEFGRTGGHSKRGEESVGQMLRLWAGHDLVHLRQIDRIKRSLRSS